MSHFIERCVDCSRVIRQCRCQSHDKLLRLVVCDTCQRKRDEIASCESSPEPEGET